jgi:hypothetical protein
MRASITFVNQFKANGPGLTGHGMDGSKLACEHPARGPVQPMVRARLRGAIHWVDAVGPGPFTAARKRRRERIQSGAAFRLSPELICSVLSYFGYR